MNRQKSRRRRSGALRLESLESRQLLSAQFPPGYAAEVVSQSMRDARPPAQSPSPVTTHVTVTPNRPSYSPGQPVHLTLRQSIVGRSPVNTGLLANYDVIVSQRGQELWRLSDERDSPPPSHVLVTMQPGEARQVSVTWNGRARDGSLVTGPVEIRAEIDRVSSPPTLVRIGSPATLPHLANRHASIRPTTPNRPALSRNHRPVPPAPRVARPSLDQLPLMKDRIAQRALRFHH